MKETKNKTKKTTTLQKMCSRFVSDSLRNSMVTHTGYLKKSRDEYTVHIEVDMLKIVIVENKKKL